MTAKDCLFCASREHGGGAVKATGRTQSRVSRYDGQPLQRYQFSCVTCGYLWWFAGNWAAEKYQAFIAEHPVEETPTEPPQARQPLLPGSGRRQEFATAGELAKDWKRKAAGDHEDVA